jgi:hypothetical protein
MSSPAQAGDPVRRDVEVNHDRLGLLDAPPSRAMTTRVLAIEECKFE